MSGRGGKRDGAGRPPGKRLDELRERIEREFPDYHPIIALLKLSESTTTIENDGVKEEKPDKNMQFQCHREIAKYLLPTLKSVELTGGDGGPIEVTQTYFLPDGTEISFPG